MSTFDSSAIDPETYFAQALMGMSMTDERFALTTCPPLCKCSMCDSLNKSCRSVATTITGADSTISDDGEDELSLFKTTTPSNDEVGLVQKILYDEGEPPSIVLPVSYSDSSPRSSLTSSRNSLEYKKASGVPNLKEEEDNAEVRQLERQLKDMQHRERELGRRKLRLEIERDGLKLMLDEADPQRRRTSEKLERIHEHAEE